MKKIFLNLLIVSILLTGCTNEQGESNNKEQEEININDKNETRDYIIEMTGSTTNIGYNEGLRCGTATTKALSVLVDLNGNGYLLVDCMNGTNDSDMDTHTNETNEIVKYIEKNSNIKFSTYEISTSESEQLKEIYAYKLPFENISYVYNEYFSTGGGNYFIFVLNNGKIAGLTDTEIGMSGKIETKVFDEFNNVEYIVSGIITKDNRNMRGPFAIDKNGNKFNLYNEFEAWFEDYRK